MIDQEDSQVALDWAVQQARTNTGILHVVPAAADIPGKPAYISPHCLEELDSALAATGVVVNALCPVVTVKQHRKAA